MCCVPHNGQYWSRVDLPFPGAVGHIASHSRARTPEQSLYRAIAGAMACGEEIESDLVDRCRLMGAMLLGDLNQVGDDEIGSFFGKLIKKAASFGTQFIPGVGPIASKLVDQGLNMADKALRKKKGAPAPKTLVRALSKGGGEPKPTEDTVRHAPTGAVSVPIATPGAPAEKQPPAMLFYHPANANGPVVVRF